MRLDPLPRLLPQTASLPLGFGTFNISQPACPTVANTPYTLSIGLVLPSGVPSGDYWVLFSSTDQAQAVA